MNEWNKKKKWMIVAAFFVVVAVVAVLAAAFSKRQTEAGNKQFTIVVESARDELSQTLSCESDQRYLGEFLRTLEECEYEEGPYGSYVTGFYGCKEDLAQQYWWCIMVGDTAATVGVDEIPLEQGAVYRFVLKQGF